MERKLTIKEILTFKEIAKSIIAMNPKQNLFWDFVEPIESVAKLETFDLTTFDWVETIEDATDLIRILVKLASAQELEQIEYSNQLCGWVVLPQDWNMVFKCEECDIYTNKGICECGAHTEYAGGKHANIE